MMNIKRGIVCAVCGALGLACGDDGMSSATDITADKDPSISSVGDGVLSGILDLSIGLDESLMGVDPGDLVTDIADGWSVGYDRILVTVGGLEAYLAAENFWIRDANVVVVNLMNVIPETSSLLQIRDVKAGSYGSMAVTMPIAATVTDCHLCDTGDQGLMEGGGYSLYVEGVMTNDAGQSCAPGDPKDCAPAPQIRFRWGIPVGTQSEACPGFTVQNNETTRVTWTVPGDRWLLTGFAQDAEARPRQAQWIADADLDRDGETTIEELQQIKASLLFPPELGYDLAGAPIAVDTAYDFLVAQVHAIGVANGCQRVMPAK